MARNIDQRVLVEALREHESLPHGHRGDYVQRTAATLGISARTLARRFEELRGVTRERSDRDRRRISGITEAVEKVWAVKRKPPKEVGALSTDQAVEIAAMRGLITEAEAAVPIATYNRVAREMGLHQVEGPHVRFEAPHANAVHQIDASVSKHLYVVAREGDDYILKLRRPAEAYRNKQRVENLRVWVYGLVDDYSRAELVRYIVEPGESAQGQIEFLRWAWCDRKDTALPICGLPDELYADQGAPTKAETVRGLLSRAEVKLTRHEAYNSKATGKRERRWRTLWQRYERPLFTEHANWKQATYRLSEINRRVERYLVSENARKHPQMLDLTRLDAWERSIRARGGAVVPRPEAFDTLYKTEHRTLDGAGTFRYGHQVYEVRGLYNCRAEIHENVRHGTLIVTDPRTGVQKVAVLHKPLEWGEYRGAKAPPGARLDTEAVPGGAMPFTQDEAPPADNVVRLGVPRPTVREVEDPIDLVGRYPSQEDAMREIARLAGRHPSAVGDQVYALLSERLVETGFDARVVRDLGLRLREALQQAEGM